MAEFLDRCKVRDVTLPAIRRPKKTLAAAQASYSAMLADPAIPAPAKNSRLILAARKKIAQTERALAQAEAARDAIPAKLRTKLIDPQANVALLHTPPPRPADGLRLRAHNADHWPSYEVMR